MPPDPHPKPHADAAPAKSRNTVFVTNKLPNGLTIYLEKQGPARVGSTEPISQMREETKVFLNGANASKIVGGYGITEVDEAFWNEWTATHADYAPLKNGILGVQPSRERARDLAIDEKKRPTGFEPIDPANPGVGINERGVKIEPLNRKDAEAA